MTPLENEPDRDASAPGNLAEATSATHRTKARIVRVVAAIHDTSVVMIERTYSAHIADHADALARGALLDAAE